MSPSDFTALHTRIESSPILTPQEKSEWLALLPRMTAEHIKELDRILSIKQQPGAAIATPPPAQAGGQENKILPEQSRRPLDFTPSTRLPARQASPGGKTGQSPVHPPKFSAENFGGKANPPAGLSALPTGQVGDKAGEAGRQSPLHPPVGTILEAKAPVVRMAQSQAADASEFTSLTVEKMRTTGSVYTFLEEIAKKMNEVKHRKGVGTQGLLEAFEASPLYRAYLETGLKIMDSKDAPLTRSEFEAMADFRATLRKLLT